MISGNVSITQPLLELGPGYQFVLGNRIHVDLGAGLVILLPPSSSTSIGGSITDLLALSNSATASFDAAKASLGNAVNQAMSDYESQYKYLPSLYVTLGFIF